jgi:hypothetical protein
MTVEEIVATARIDLTDLPDHLELPQKTLLSRRAGAHVLELLREGLGGVSQGTALRVGIGRIDYMDASFTDEAFARLQAELVAGVYGDRFLILEEPNESIAYEIGLVVDRRRPRLPMLAADAGGVITVLGRLEPNLREAWEMVGSERDLRTRDLADRLRIEVAAASMRLHKLHTARLLSREEEMTSAGRQHVYRLPA